jgi:hypothetical protein
MHYKLFKSVGLTVEWAGNSKEVFKPYYKRLVTKTDARKFWLMLPSLLKTGGDIQVNLPANHQLDSAMTKEVAAAIPVACQAMSRATAKTAAAKATLAAAKSKALKARNAAHSKKSREKTQAKKRAAQPEKGSDNAAGAPPLPKAA